MTRASAILWAKSRIAINQIASVRHESKLKVGVVSVSAVLLWFGAYFLFWSAFRWLKMYEMDAVRPGFGIGELIMSRMLSVFALALFFMLLFSNTLIAYSTLYKARENAYLVQAPIPWWEYYLARLVECIARLGSEVERFEEPFTRAEWRAWLLDHLEAERFSDAAIVSPVVLTRLAATIASRVAERPDNSYTVALLDHGLGRDAILKWINGEPDALNTTPVFGCLLNDDVELDNARSGGPTTCPH